MADNTERAGLFEQLLAEITSIKQENANLKKEVDAFDEKTVATVKDIFKDMISVLDEFARTEAAIAEKGLDETEEAQKVRDRFLKVAKRLKSKLENNGVQEIPIAIGDKMDETLCSTTDTEPDSTKENDTIISIEKKGYTFKGIVLRPAEVIIVKN